MKEMKLIESLCFCVCVCVCVCVCISKKDLKKMSHNVLMEGETAASENINRSLKSAWFQMFGCTLKKMYTFP